LEGRNAALNIAKLGAVSNTYLRNIYGEMRDSINAGLPTDRLQVDWWVESRRVKMRLSGQRARLGFEQVASGGAALINRAAFQSDGTPWPSAWQLPASLLAMAEVPASFQTLKRKDSALAHAWRQHTRELFEACFAAGYIVTDFLSETVEGWPRNFYVLTRQEEGGPLSAGSHQPSG
jgi:predicted GNAT superfamily acetyltransferase